MKKRFRFVGTYLFDGDEVVGTIKDNETIYLIEELLNGFVEENRILNKKLESLKELMNIVETFAEDSR